MISYLIVLIVSLYASLNCVFWLLFCYITFKSNGLSNKLCKIFLINICSAVMPLELVFLPLRFENNLLRKLVYRKHTFGLEKHADVFFFDDFTIKKWGESSLAGDNVTEFALATIYPVCNMLPINCLVKGLDHYRSWTCQKILINIKQNLEKKNSHILK